MNRKTNEASLKDILRELIDHYRLRGKLDQTKLKQQWPEVVGPMIARHTTELRIRHRKLFLHIDAPALRQELSYGRDKMKNLVNEALGGEHIDEVIIR